MTTRLSRDGGKWLAICRDCSWRYQSSQLATAHTEATYHTCKPVLGPRPTPPGTTFGDASSMPIGVEEMPRGWHAGAHRLEVW